MPEKTSKPIIRKTGDGSTSLYSPKFDQLYHNPHGAVTESRHVFFNTNGLLKTLKSRPAVTIFEVWFGTGLNLLMVLELMREANFQTNVNFYSVEAFPIDANITEDFEYSNEPGLRKSLLILRSILQDLSGGMNRIRVTDNIILHLFVGPFDDLFAKHEESPIINDKIDFILHDPFSPEANPELWAPDVFKKLASVSSDDVILSTYCAASSARAAMSVAGWKVARAPGAVGKREMTLASLDEVKLDAFKRVNEKRLTERFEAGDFDG